MSLRSFGLLICTLKTVECLWVFIVEVLLSWVSGGVNEY